MPINYPTTDIRSIGINSGDPGAYADLNKDQSKVFGLALMDLLKSYQGIERKPFLGQEFGAQEQQVKRLSFTDPSLIGAAPSVQSQARNASVAAVEPTVQGARQSGQTFASQLETFGSTLGTGLDILREFSSQQDKERDDARNLVNQALTTFGSKGFDVIDKKYLKLAGYDQKMIDTAKQTLKEQEIEAKRANVSTQVVDVDGRKKLINSQTGQVISDLGASTTGGGSNDLGNQYQAERVDRIISSVDNLLPEVSNKTVGLGSYLSGVRGTDAYNFRANLETLKANISFGELQAMRNASKTGGALGQVAVRELELLESTLGSLDQGQSPEIFKINLSRIKESMKRWKEAQNQSLNQTTQSSSGTTVMIAPDGSKWNVPNNQVSLFKQNGYK